MTKVKLTAKQQRFIEEYLIDLNGTRAAKAAGYSEKTARNLACETLAKPYIQEAIQEALEAQKERTELTADYVINSLREVHHQAMNPVEGQKTNLNAANRALDLLGRHMGMFTDRMDVSIHPTHEEMLDQLDAQLFPPQETEKAL